MKRHMTTVLATTAALIWGLPQASGSDLQKAVDAHTAAVARIESLQLNMTVTQNFPGLPPKESYHYWRLGDRQRIRSAAAGGAVDGYIDPDRIISLGTKRDSKTGHPAMASMHANVAPVALSSSPWREALLGLNSDKGPGSLTLREFVRTRGNISCVTEGRFVTLKSGDAATGAGEVTIVLDKSHNYLISSIEIRDRKTFANGVTHDYHTAHTVTAFAEPTPGCHFPVSTRIVRKVDGVQRAEALSQFDSVRINAKIEPATLVPRYPRGTFMRDYIQGMQYTVDENGQPTSTPVKLQTAAVLSGPPRKGGGEGGDGVGGATEDEPSRRAWWLIPGSLSLAAAFAAWVTHRRSKRQLPGTSAAF